jgi:K+-transporting ATPase ATPase C chain
MKRHLLTALLYTIVTAVLLGVVYPLAITGVARLAFPARAAGQLLMVNGEITGSKLIGQPFTGPRYFHSRPSAAGAGYDAANSSGSNLGPTSKALGDRLQASVTAEAGSGPIPIDLVTTSGSGLDPDISPAAALYQVRRVATERKLSVETVQSLVTTHTTQRQFGLLGEPRVNVLDLNLALDRASNR